MRILPFMPSDEGYEPSSIEINQEEAILDISHPAKCVLCEESKIAAETLILRCSLRPLPLRNKKIKVQLIAEGEVLNEAPLYDEESLTFGYEREVQNSQWQGVALEYMGVGQGVHQGKTFPIDGKTFPDGQIEMGSPLYIKPFKIETSNHQERVTTFNSGQFLVSPPGILDAQVLRSYGGYYKESIPLEEIQQIYYCLTSAHTRTKIRLLTSAHLQEQHTPPPYGGKAFHHQVIFSPVPSKEEYLSFPGAIAAGYARIAILTETGRRQFFSYLCEPLPGHSGFLNVYFRP